MFPRIRIVAALLVMSLLLSTGLNAAPSRPHSVPREDQAGLLERLVEWVAVIFSPAEPGDRGPEPAQAKIATQLDPDGNH